jgi:putative phosphoribosyl transferase
MFQNRIEAAKQLASRLQHYKGTNPLVLAVPRGGVPMAKVIADALGGDLDVVLVHKLGHPDNAEYAIGAIDEDGNIYLDDPDLRNPAAEARYLTRLKALRQQYTPIKQRIDPAGRTVILVDDGIATGWTLKAAIALLKRAKAHKIVIAVPVGARDSVDELRSDLRVAELICLETPRHFGAVGQFYADFAQVEDDEVAQILASEP